MTELNADELRDALWAKVVARYVEKENIVPREILTRVERDLMLQIVDQQWKDHLYSLDHLKEGIGLRGYGQRDPLVEYKKESFALFQDMRRRIEEEIVRYLWWLKPVRRARRRRADHCRSGASGAEEAGTELQQPVGGTALGLHPEGAPHRPASRTTSPTSACPRASAATMPRSRR